MRPARRGFLRAALAASATGALPRLSWADAGAPAYLAAAKTPDGHYALHGLTAAGAARFQIPLPGRGHAAAAHPSQPLAVAFARRPGVFALVIDCALGETRARLEAPPGRHFYGHGAFDAEGARLYTCENDFEAGEGRIGVWDASDSFRRINELPSGGVGPHELLFDRAQGRLIVANGGVQTHPDSGRAKLNLPMMRPNLAYLSPETGAALEIIEPPKALRRNSIRHLSLRADGAIGIALQWQGDLPEPVPLLATHRFGAPALTFLEAPEPEQLRLQGYGGSVAFSGDGALLGVTSPRGGRAHLFDIESSTFLGAAALPDVCGLASHGDGLLCSDGLGGLHRLGADVAPTTLKRHNLAWDNHLVGL
ncbi:MAG: DUF1513 domain-containing protein [Rhodobacteraceae bacterium]|nr:DUF1513 domain-containing protein [Paracoccaceae bacterium]